jgi:cysteine synthase A
MKARGESGSIVSLLCDGADRYAGTYRSDAWVTECGWDLTGHTATLARAWDEGIWDEAARRDA